MRYLPKLIILGLLLIAAPVIALAQEDCAALFVQAIQATGTACQSLARNQACFGAGSITALGGDGSSLNFSQSGDILDAASLQSLRLTTSDAGWSAVAMKLQFNLPDRKADQNVVMLLLGDVELTSGIEAVAALPTLTMTAARNANIRSGPSKNASVLGSLAKDEIVIANGRSEDSTWLRFTREDGNFGWVFGELVTVEGDVSTLAVVEAAANAEARPTPLSDFHFTSGGGTGKCAGILPSGILIQSPDGLLTAQTAQIKMMINGVSVDMGSTVYAEAAPGGDLSLSVFEHYAEAVADEAYQLIPEGWRGDIPMDNGEISGPPSLNDPSQAVEAFNDLVDMLNDALNGENEDEGILNRDIVLPEVVFSPDDPSAAVEVYGAGGVGVQYQLAQGPWWLSFEQGTTSCPISANVLRPRGVVAELDRTFELDDNQFLLSFNDGQYLIPFDNPIPNYYIAIDKVDIVTSQYQFEVESPLLISGAISGSVDDGVNHCVITTPVLMASCAFIALSPDALPPSVQDACKNYDGTPISY